MGFWKSNKIALGGHVLKPKTIKRNAVYDQNERNDRNNRNDQNENTEMTETTKTKPPKQAEPPKRNRQNQRNQRNEQMGFRSPQNADSTDRAGLSTIYFFSVKSSFHETPRKTDYFCFYLDLGFKSWVSF